MHIHKILVTFIFLVTTGKSTSLIAMEVKVPKKIFHEIEREKNIKIFSNLWNTFEEKIYLHNIQNIPYNFFFINHKKIVIDDTILNLQTNTLYLKENNSKPFFTRYYYDHNNESIHKKESHQGLVHFNGWLCQPPVTIKKRIYTNKFIEKIPAHLIIHACYFDEHGSICVILFQEKNSRIQKIALCTLQPFSIVTLLKTVEEYEVIENISINQSGTRVIAFVTNNLYPQQKYKLIQYLPKNLTQPLSINKERIEHLNNVNFAFE